MTSDDLTAVIVIVVVLIVVLAVDLWFSRKKNRS